MVFRLFIVSHSGVGFWKVLALGLFFVFHGAVGFWKVLVRRSPGRCCGRFWLGKLTEQKKVKTPQVLALGLFLASPCAVGFWKLLGS